MEFILILLHDDGKTCNGDTVPYQDDVRLNPRQADELAEMICEEIRERLDEEGLSHPARHLLPVITTTTTHGAEIRVMPDAYNVLDEIFSSIVRDCWLQYRWIRQDRCWSLDSTR